MKFPCVQSFATENIIAVYYNAIIIHYMLMVIMILRKFSKCSLGVKCFLFKSYCSSLYCPTLCFVLFYIVV